MIERITSLADKLRSARYPDASAVFAAGSFIRGDATPSSDLDLVVVYAKLPNAFRESFTFDGVPVEAFVHDPETMEYFFLEVDRRSGVPALPQMVVEGVEIPQPTPTSRALKELAASVIAAGPPPLDRETEQRMRYAVSDLVDDLRAPRSREELLATGSRLYEQLADYYLRRSQRWSARAKGIPRVLQRTDPELGRIYSASFEALFADSDTAPVIELAERLLRQAGGPLFDGYRSDAPAAWRTNRPGP